MNEIYRELYADAELIFQFISFPQKIVIALSYLKKKPNIDFSYLIVENDNTSMVSLPCQQLNILIFNVKNSSKLAFDVSFYLVWKKEFSLYLK